MESVEKTWTETWKPILMKDGQVDVEQLKKELADFSDLIDRHTKLVCAITRHRMSYPTYEVDKILAVVDECVEDEREDQKKDDRDDGACSLCEREFNEECKHPGCCCVCGHQGKCPEDGPSIID